MWGPHCGRTFNQEALAGLRNLEALSGEHFGPEKCNVWVIFLGHFWGHFWSSSSIAWIFLEDSTSQLVKVTSFLSRLSERSEAGQRHIAICLRTFGGKGRPKAGAAKRFLCGLPKSGRAGKAENHLNL